MFFIKSHIFPRKEEKIELIDTAGLCRWEALNVGFDYFLISRPALATVTTKKKTKKNLSFQKHPPSCGLALKPNLSEHTELNRPENTSNFIF